MQIRTGTTAELLLTPSFGGVFCGQNDEPTLDSHTLTDDVGNAIPTQAAVWSLVDADNGAWGWTAIVPASSVAASANGQRWTDSWKWHKGAQFGERDSDVYVISAAHYGSVAGVEDYVGATGLRFTTTSNPSVDTVERILSQQSELMDARISAAGYIVPVTTEAALPVVDRICERKTAAEVIMRAGLLLSPEAVNLAQMWEKAAESDFVKVLKGGVAIPAAVDPSKQDSTVPRVTVQQPAIPSDTLDQFVSQWGALFNA